MTTHRAQAPNSAAIHHGRSKERQAQMAAFAESMNPSEMDSATSQAPGDSQSPNTRGNATKRPKSKQHPVVDKPEFCLVVVPDGDVPALEIFLDVASLTKRLRSLDGEDCNAFPFFGVPMPFTAGPDRFLRLPAGQPHPIFDFSGYGQFVADSHSTVPVDSSYYLGDARRVDGPAGTVVDHRPDAKPADGRKAGDPDNQGSGRTGNSDAATDGR